MSRKLFTMHRTLCEIAHKRSVFIMTIFIYWLNWCIVNYLLLSKIVKGIHVHLSETPYHKIIKNSLTSWQVFSCRTKWLISLTLNTIHPWVSMVSKNFRFLQQRGYYLWNDPRDSFCNQTTVVRCGVGWANSVVKWLSIKIRTLILGVNYNSINDILIIKRP